MSHLLAKERGFTLFELLAAVVIVGILAAIGIPSLVGLVNASKVRDAQSQVHGIIRGAQRQALVKSTDCELQFNNISSPPVTISDTNTASTVACLTANTLKLPEDVKIATNLSGTPPKLGFNFKGRLKNIKEENNLNTIVFYSDKAKQKRCLVIAPFLGMMRAGEYTGAVTDPITANSCKTTTNTL
jgi:prepilin-type N-terminal cleavage/methylation domain-containing protein